MTDKDKIMADISSLEQLDTLYKEPKDGIISIKKNEGKEYSLLIKNLFIPEYELVTLIDLSTLWEDKQYQAGKIAEELQFLNHENLLNITRPIRYLDGDFKNRYLEISSECPDHISSWKSFCKRPYKLHQTISIFR